MKSAAAETGSPLPMRRTSALPTIAASAYFVTAATCSGVEIPNPAAMGSLLTDRMAFTELEISGLDSCSPVNPARAKR